MNIKGEGTPVWIIIAIALGLIVLVVMALSFTGGFQQIWDKLNVFAGTGSLTTIGQACQIACTSGDVTSYCKQARSAGGLTQAQVNEIEKKVEGSTTNSTAPGKIDGKFSGVTCKNLANAGIIAVCSEISC